MLCDVPLCKTPAKVRGLCIKHYHRLLRHGDPEFTLHGALPEVQPGNRWCRKCESELPLKAFYRSALQSHKCRECTKVARRAAYTPKPRATPEPWKDPEGYLRFRPVAGARWRFQHQLVMEETLGRPLAKGENVHHRNGVRDDNRPENLELWVKTQPCGQRPEDLVAWAEQILERYGSLVGSRILDN